MAKRSRKIQNVSLIAQEISGKVPDSYKEAETLVEQRTLFRKYLTELKKVSLFPKQVELFKILENPDNKIILISGPAGTAKTFMTCYYTISALCKTDFEKGIFTKPLEESGERLGFLPGDIKEKTEPFFESYKHNLLKILKKDMVDKFFDKKLIEYKPLAYLRGTSFENNLLVIDEAQNADLRQIMLFVTRMGKGSKVIILGDTSQYDIKGSESGLTRFKNMISGVEGVAEFRFEKEDIQRDPILIEITDRYEKMMAEAKSKGQSIENKKGVGSL